jgi:L-ascorbate metabolism protein UlaG (beta-lactamase superfamily)
VFCNESVGAILSGENIEHTVMSDGTRVEEKEVVIEGLGTTHATIHASLPESMNTGYFIANRLWYPGDAFTDPKRAVDILALPIAGPWMKMSEALEYAIALKPRVAFPVHDGILNPTLLNMNAFPYRVPSTVLEPRGIRFLPLEINKDYEL